MALSYVQRQARRKGLGGSDIAGILGVSKWSTPYQIWCTKDKPNMAAEESIEEEQNEQQEWGNLLESIIIQTYQKRTGKECIITDSNLPPFQHPEYPFLLANIDAKIANENAILEVKMARLTKEWGKEESDEMPLPYLLQVMHYSAVLGLEKVYVAVLIQGSELRFYEYNKNERQELNLIKRAVAWWERHIINEVTPCPLDTSDAVALWGQHTLGLSRVITPEIQESIEVIKQYKNQEKQFKNEIENNKVNVFSYMQEAETLTDESGNIIATWKTQSRTNFDTTKFKKECPELYKQYLIQGSSRVFRLKGEKE